MIARKRSAAWKYILAILATILAFPAVIFLLFAVVWTATWAIYLIDIAPWPPGTGS